MRKWVLSVCCCSQEQQRHQDMVESSGVPTEIADDCVLVFHNNKNIVDMWLRRIGSQPALQRSMLQDDEVLILVRMMVWYALLMIGFCRSEDARRGTMLRTFCLNVVLSGLATLVVVERPSTCQDSHLTGKPGASQESPLRVAPGGPQLCRLPRREAHGRDRCESV